jgi:hypothetical protein
MERPAWGELVADVWPASGPSRAGAMLLSNALKALDSTSIAPSGSVAIVALGSVLQPPEAEPPAPVAVPAITEEIIRELNNVVLLKRVDALLKVKDPAWGSPFSFRMTPTSAKEAGIGHYFTVVPESSATDLVWIRARCALKPGEEALPPADWPSHSPPRAFETVDAFDRELHQMVENSRRFNGASHGVTHAGEDLLRRWEKSKVSTQREWDSVLRSMR